MLGLTVVSTLCLHMWWHDGKVISAGPLHGREKYFIVASPETIARGILCLDYFVSPPMAPLLSFALLAAALSSKALAFTPIDNKTYEYIVVGSGPGGSPLASNLARAGHSVLLIEAGDDQTENV